MLVRLSRAPVVSIASIRGRATGVGSELALASDMRFASREKAILSQWEVGAGLVPGGGPMARLPRLIGRGRALEVLLGADDIGGDLAERYGYVNRSLPDAELDAFVDALAIRIVVVRQAGDRGDQALVDVNSLPPDAEIAPEWDAFLAALGGARRGPSADQEAVRARLSQPGDVETRLGLSRRTARPQKERRTVETSIGASVRARRNGDENPDGPHVPRQARQYRPQDRLLAGGVRGALLRVQGCGS